MRIQTGEKRGKEKESKETVKKGSRETKEQEEVEQQKRMTAEKEQVEVERRRSRKHRNVQKKESKPRKKQRSRKERSKKSREAEKQIRMNSWNSKKTKKNEINSPPNCTPKYDTVLYCKIFSWVDQLTNWSYRLIAQGFPCRCLEDIGCPHWRFIRKITKQRNCANKFTCYPNQFLVGGFLPSEKY